MAVRPMHYHDRRWVFEDCCPGHEGADQRSSEDAGNQSDALHWR